MIVVLALLAAPARAAVVERDGAVVGPVVDGDGFTWVTESPRATVVRAWRDGTVRDRVRLRPRSLRKLPGALAASRTWLAFVSGTTLWHRRGGGPFARRRGAVVAAADGEALAWTAPARGRFRVVLRDGPMTRTFDAGRMNEDDRGFPMRILLAGPYVGWVGDGTGVTVVERAGGRRILHLAGDVADAALQADGALVALVRSGGRTDLVRLSPAAPAPEVLVPRVDDGTVAAARDRVVFGVAEDVGDALAIVPLAGGTPRELVRYATPEREIRTFAFDGRRLAWNEDPQALRDVVGAGRIHVLDVP